MASSEMHMSTSPQTCPRCGRPDTADVGFCYCGHIFAPTSATHTPSPSEAAPTDPMPCPECGQVSDSIKCFHMTHTMLFLLIWFAVWERTFVACPACMRRILRRRLLFNIPTATLIWPALLLIYLPRFAATYQPGHSRALTHPPSIGRSRWRIVRFLEEFGYHKWQYILLIVAVICSAALSFGPGLHSWLDPSRIIFVAVAGLLLGRIIADVIASGREDEYVYR